MKKCPICGKFNTLEATYCDCGKSLKIEYAEPGDKVMWKETKRQLEGKTGEGVVIKDIDMPFWSMVVFMVKWAFAAIPAIIIIAVIISLCGSVLTGLIIGTSK